MEGLYLIIADRLLSTNDVLERPPITGIKEVIVVVVL